MADRGRRAHGGAVLIALAMLLAACSDASGTTTTTSQAPTTAPATTLPAPTTTTLPRATTLPPPPTTSVPAPPAAVFSFDGPAELGAEIEALYAWLADPAGRPAPALPDGLLLHLSGIAVDTDIVAAGAGATAELPSGDTVAVATFTNADGDDDVILAVQDAGADWRIVGAKLDRFDKAAWYGESPRLVLVIGSDARPGENQQRLRADSIHILGSVPEDAAAAIVGFPRDSWVPGPTGGNMKLTSVLAGRGPEVFFDTTLGLTDLPLEGYVITGFLGFETMINQLGGLFVDLPTAIRSGFDFVANWPAGPQTLNGDRLLWLSRIRKTLAGGDFKRSENQGMVMLFGLDMVQGRGILDLPDLLSILGANTWTDLSTEDLLTLAAGAYELERDQVVNMVLPGTPGRAGAASVVFLGNEFPEVMADLADGVIDGDW